MLTSLSETKIDASLSNGAKQMFDSADNELLDCNDRELWCGGHISTLSASVQINQLSTEVEVTI